MITMSLTGIRKIEQLERPIPTLKNQADVLIRIKTVGVCGSDIHYFTEGRIGTQVVKFPFTIGHECSGVVEKTGSLVNHVKPGDLVAVDPSIHCGTCDQCLAGRPHTCRHNLFLGCPGQLEGCLSEYIVMPEYTCFVMDQTFNPTMAALIEPLTIGTYSVELAKTEFQDKTIGIFGAGPIGWSVLNVLKTRNAYRIFCFEPLDYRRTKATESGADFTYDPFEKDALETISAVEPLLLDIVFDCSGEQKAINDAIRILKPGGKLVLTGIPPHGLYTFDMDMMRRKEITVINVRRQNHCIEKSIGLVKDGLPIEKMVSHRFQPQQTQQAFDLVSSYQDGVMKAMIDFF